MHIAELKDPTPAQAAAVFLEPVTSVWHELNARKWRRFGTSKKKAANGKTAAWQLALRAIAHEQGTDAVVDELVAMGCPEPRLNGKGSNGSDTIIVGPYPRTQHTRT